MAFKLPQEPIRNRKEFITYLLATACGVGLALSLERVAEWWKMRSLVNEARRNLAEEIADTRSRLANWRKNVPDMAKNFENVSDYTEEMITRGTTDRHELAVGFQFPALNNAAWKAAEATGAAGHMSYAETKRYAELYTLQAEFQRVQGLTLDELGPLMAFFRKDVDPTRNQRREDMERLGRDVRVALMRLKTLESLSKTVDELGLKIANEHK